MRQQVAVDRDWRRCFALLDLYHCRRCLPCATTQTSEYCLKNYIKKCTVQKLTHFYCCARPQRIADDDDYFAGEQQASSSKMSLYASVTDVLATPHSSAQAPSMMPPPTNTKTSEYASVSGLSGMQSQYGAFATAQAPVVYEAALPQAKGSCVFVGHYRCHCLKVFFLVAVEYCALR